MTGPRPDFLETLRQMAQKPDASAVSRTSRPTPGLLDFLKMLGEHIDQRVSSGLPEGTQRGVMPDYIGGPQGGASQLEGAAAKLAAEMPSGQPDLLGALKRLGHSKPPMPSLLAPQQGPLMQAGKGVPISDDVTLFRGQLKGYHTGPGYTKGGATIGEWWTSSEREAAEYAARASESWKRLQGTSVEKASKNWAPSGDAVILKAVVPKDVAEMYSGPTDGYYVIPPAVAGQFLRRPK